MIVGPRTATHELFNVHTAVLALRASAVLYQHLTGDASSRCFVPVLGPGTVHVLQFSDPQALVDALAASEDCD